MPTPRRHGRGSGTSPAHFRKIIELLGLDLDDPNLVETPERVAKMYLELFEGLAEGAEPKVTFFPNDERYSSMVIEKDIPFYSLCSHHFVPFYGHAHVAYIPNQSIVGPLEDGRASSSSTPAGPSSRSA